MIDARQIGALAARALVLEAAAAPKPGLVDAVSRGAHRDMDYFTFMESAAALAPHFERLARIGARGVSLDGIFPRLRRAGLRAERAMFAATGGVNTHKGAIFSLGLVCGAAGFLLRDGRPPDIEAVCAAVADMTRGLAERELSDGAGRASTNGERVFRRYGARGARGEAQSGFENVRRCGLPALEDALSHGANENDACVHALLALMAEVNDTNVLFRHDAHTARWLRNRSKALFDGRCALNADGRERVRALDREMTARGVSPGGCADLLAVTVLLHDLRRVSRPL